MERIVSARNITDACGGGDVEFLRNLVIHFGEDFPDTMQTIAYIADCAARYATVQVVSEAA
jgi:hypothetical protein